MKRSRVNEPPPLPPRRRAFHPGLTIALALGGLLLAALIYFSVWRSSLASANAARLKAIAAAGEPVSARELDAWYESVPDSENAALVWLEGIASLEPKYEKNRPSPWSQLKFPARTNRLEETFIRECEDLVSRNEAALRLFHRAASMSNSRYPVDLGQSAFAEFPHLGPLKSSCELLQAEALAHMYHRRGPESVATIMTILGAARSLEKEPIIISQLVRCALAQLASRMAERILNQIALTDADLSTLQMAFAEAENPEAFTRALIGERASSITLINSPSDIRAPAANEEISTATRQMERGFNNPLMRALGVFQWDFGFYLDSMATNIAVSRMSEPQMFLARTNIEQWEGKLGRWNFLSMLLLPANSKIVVRETQHRAGMRVTRVAMTLERYRSQHRGRLPQSLSDLTPEHLASIPADPFDGRALRFKPKASGYVLYSIGADAKEDDGLEVPKHRQTWHYAHDLTFVVERAQDQ